MFRPATAYAITRHQVGEKSFKPVLPVFLLALLLSNSTSNWRPWKARNPHALRNSTWPADVFNLKECTVRGMRLSSDICHMPSTQKTVASSKCRHQACCHEICLHSTTQVS